MTGLLSLYLKELKAYRIALIVYTLVAVALVIFFLVIFGGMIQLMEEESIGGATGFLVLLSPLLLVLNLFPIWLLFISYRCLSNEWKDGSVALSLALPVRPWSWLTAKLAALVTMLLLLFLTPVVLLTLLSALDIIPASSPREVFFAGGSGTVMVLVLYLPLVPAAFSVFLSGSSLSRYSFLARLVIVAALMVTTWLGTRLASFASWEIHPVEAFSPYLIGIYAAGTLGFVLSLYFLEKGPVA